MLESGSSGSGLGRYAVLRCHMTPLRSRVMITSNLVEYDYRLVPRAFSSTIFKMAASHFEKWRRPWERGCDYRNQLGRRVKNPITRCTLTFVGLEFHAWFVCFSVRMTLQDNLVHSRLPSF